MHKYEITIYWNNEDNIYIAEVPELAGCMADGANYSEALQNAEIIINEWIETAKLLGRDIPTPKSRFINVATPDDLAAIAIAREEYRRGETISESAIDWN